MTNELTDVLHALADPTRRALFERLILESATITELSEPFDMTSVAVSKHLRVLEKARLVRRSKMGRSMRFVADIENIGSATEFFEKFKKRLDKKSDLHTKYWRAKKRK